MHGNPMEGVNIVPSSSTSSWTRNYCYSVAVLVHLIIPSNPMEVVNSVLVALVVAVVEVVVSKYVSHFYLGDIGKYKIKIIEFE